MKIDFWIEWMSWNEYGINFWLSGRFDEVQVLLPGAPEKCTTWLKRCSILKLHISTKYGQFDRRNFNLDFDTNFLKIKQKLAELWELEDRNALNLETKGSFQF